MIKLSVEQQRVLEQFRRSNYYEVIVGILNSRADEHSKALRIAGPNVFAQIQGRAQEIDDLVAAFKNR